MPATEGEIKLVARITALEILVQQLICLACNRDLDEVEDYRERVMEDASIRPDSRSALHKKAPVTACRSSGLSTPAIQLRGPMSFIATFISLVVIIGAALVVLTAVVGYGCYSLFREFSAKPPRQLDA
jgi:hypothetical protein